MKYQTQAGDRLDTIAWQAYGRTQDTVEAILEANPKLADLGAVLPAGVILYLPPLSLPKAQTSKVRLWD